jgi:hypothetical protein
MTSVYAQIQSGIVVNMIIAQATDYFDPTYTWVDLTNLYCIDGTPIQIGCTYDGTNFYSQVNNG